MPCRSTQQNSSPRKLLFTKDFWGIIEQGFRFFYSRRLRRRKTMQCDPFPLLGLRQKYCRRELRKRKSCVFLLNSTVSFFFNSRRVKEGINARWPFLFSRFASLLQNILRECWGKRKHYISLIWSTLSFSHPRQSVNENNVTFSCSCFSLGHCRGAIRKRIPLNIPPNSSV